MIISETFPKMLVFFDVFLIYLWPKTGLEMLTKGVASFSQSISPRSLSWTRFSPYLMIWTNANIIILEVGRQNGPRELEGVHTTGVCVCVCVCVCVDFATPGGGEEEAEERVLRRLVTPKGVGGFQLGS